MYKAYTSRQAFQNSLQVHFEAAFVNLEQDKNNNLVPDPGEFRKIICSILEYISAW